MTIDLSDQYTARMDVRKLSDLELTILHQAVTNEAQHRANKVFGHIEEKEGWKHG